jgi:hypothetical protein
VFNEWQQTFGRRCTVLVNLKNLMMYVVVTSLLATVSQRPGLTRGLREQGQPGQARMDRWLNG